MEEEVVGCMFCTQLFVNEKERVRVKLWILYFANPCVGICHKHWC